MACKFYIDNKVLNEQEIKQYIGEKYINKEDIRLTTIEDLANILAYSNSKLILPGYEVEYTTPDNNKFKTYAEASKHITELAKSVEDVDLSNIGLNIRKKVEKASEIPVNKFVDEFDNTTYNKKDDKWYVEDTNRVMLDDDILTLWNSNLSDNYINKAGVEGFIEQNKQFEQSKEIIEEWKKVNNIQYNPEEIYSRGQEFSSVVGAYSNFDVNLMMQNLLSHIEDNEKAGGKFAISAFTKPVDKSIGHLEGGGGKIKFKIYPKSEDILWAANTDVYSGSVWDASEKVNKDKKSELLGVSYTKYPALRNIDSVQPNLASIVDNLSHHHNELAISLNFSNFELEVDEDIPYTTKKIIDSINRILEQKRNGKLIKPEIENKSTFRNEYGQTTIRERLENPDYEKGQYNKVDGYYVHSQIKGELELFDTIEEAVNYIKELKAKYEKGIQPTTTNENLKESIESIKRKNTSLKENQWVVEPYAKGEYAVYTYMGGFVEGQPTFTSLEEANKWLKENQPKAKEYTSQALINTKIAALKEVAKKYPRSLIRSEVKPIMNWQESAHYDMFDIDELPFQKLSSKKDIEEFKQFISGAPMFMRTPEVDYSLKLVTALMNLVSPKETKRTRKYGEKTEPERLTIRLNTKEKPYLEENIRKTLNNKGVTNQQVDFVFDYMKSNNIQEISTFDLAVAIATNYSFTVEINLSTEFPNGRGDIPYKQLEQLNNGIVPEYFSVTSDFDGLLPRKENIFRIPSGKIGLWKNKEYDDKIQDLVAGEEQNIHGVEFWRLKDEIANKFLEEYKKDLEIEIEEQESNIPKPTQYYSNLTVNENFYKNNPDWEYKEQRITTPLITPIIKGHAQFAESNDIGWFRAWYNKKTGEVHVLEVQSDLFQKSRDIKEKLEEGEYKSKDNWSILTIKNGTYHYSDFDSSKYISIEEALIWGKENNIYLKKIAPNLLREHKADFKSLNNIQVGDTFLYNNDPDAEFTIGSIEFETENVFYEEENEYNKLEKRIIKDTKGNIISEDDIYSSTLKGSNNQKANEFLQLLNKNNNWVTFFVKSIIQDTAKQTITEVQESDVEVKIRELEKEGLLEMDCKGKLKAEKGIATLFEKGGKWEIVTDFKNAPTHKSGGKDISIQSKKVEVEKNELRIENDFGDVAVIPSKYRIEVQDAIKSNCHSCIDGIVESLPKMKDYAGDGTVFPFFGRYKRFKNSLPDNLKNTPEDDYAMRYYWRKSDKPKSFDEAINREQPMFTMEDDGYYHAPSVEPNTLRFLKPKNHPTLQYELDWYNSDNPEAIDFRSKYDLDTSGKFYRYVPKKLG